MADKDKDNIVSHPQKIIQEWEKRGHKKIVPREQSILVMVPMTSEMSNNLNRTSIQRGESVADFAGHAVTAELFLQEHLSEGWEFHKKKGDDVVPLGLKNNQIADDEAIRQSGAIVRRIQVPTLMETVSRIKDLGGYGLWTRQ